MEKQPGNETSDDDANDKAKQTAQQYLAQIGRIGRRRMEITPENITILASVIIAVAGFLASIDHKPFAVKVLFISLVLYSFAFCLYLHNHVQKAALAQSLPVNPSPSTGIPIGTATAPSPSSSLAEPSGTPFPPLATPDQDQPMAASTPPSTPKLLPIKPGSDKPAKSAMADKDKAASIDNRITNSPIVNSPGSVQAPGGNVTVNQAPPQRKLTVEQRQRLLAILKSEPKGDIVVTPMTGNAESFTFARQLNQLLIEAGWTSRIQDITVFGDFPTGLALLFDREAPMPLYASALLQGFERIKVPIRTEPTKALVYQKLNLFVGFRPEE